MSVQWLWAYERREALTFCGDVASDPGFVSGEQAAFADHDLAVDHYRLGARGWGQRERGKPIVYPGVSQVVQPEERDVCTLARHEHAAIVAPQAGGASGRRQLPPISTAPSGGRAPVPLPRRPR